MLGEVLCLVIIPCGRSGGHRKCITNEAWGPVVISIITVTGELHILPPRRRSLSVYCRYVFPAAEAIVKKCSYIVQKIVSWGGRTGLYPLAIFSFTHTYTHTHTHTYIHTYTLSLTHTHTQSLYRIKFQRGSPFNRRLEVAPC